MTYLTAFLEAFRFIKRYRQREAERLNATRAEAAAERAHQLAMVTSISDKLIEFARTQQTGQLEVAKALTAQAEVMATWLKGFQVSDPTPIAPQVVRDEDEWLKENETEILSNLPPEFLLAARLQGLNVPDSGDDFDREGSDFLLTP